MALLVLPMCVIISEEKFGRFKGTHALQVKLCSLTV